MNKLNKIVQISIFSRKLLIEAYFIPKEKMKRNANLKQQNMTLLK